MEVTFSKAIARYCWKMLPCYMYHNHMLVLCAGKEIVWHLPKFLGVSLLEKVAGWWFGLHCPLSSYFSAMLRQEFPRRRIFFLQDPQPEHLTSVLSLATNLFHDLPQGKMPFSASISFPSFSICMLSTLHGVIIQRNFKCFHYSKAMIFLCVPVFSTRHTTCYPEESQRNQCLVHCRRLCIRPHIAVDISAFRVWP